jgi:hypothetical protein
MKGQVAHTPALGDPRYGSGHIDERDIAYGELHTLIVLVDRRLAGDLKHSLVMVQIVEANIPLGALESVGIIATDIRCGYGHPVHAQGAQLTGEGVGIRTHQVVPPAKRAQQSAPLLVIHPFRTEKMIALTHRCLHFYVHGNMQGQRYMEVSCQTEELRR